VRSRRNGAEVEAGVRKQRLGGLGVPRLGVRGVGGHGGDEVEGRRGELGRVVDEARDAVGEAGGAERQDDGGEGGGVELEGREALAGAGRRRRRR
jgi:hypothetical protein